MQSIRQMYNVLTQIVRFIDLMNSIRKELKLKIFDRQYLIIQLMNNVKSFFIVVFADEFELYQNMYRILIKVYVFSAELSAHKRQNSKNAYIIILSFHGFDFNDVINSFHISLNIADRECVVNIREKKTSM